MPEEISIADLDPRQAKQIEAAETAEKMNPSYALEVLGAVLKQVPGCLRGIQSTKGRFGELIWSELKMVGR